MRKPSIMIAPAVHHDKPVVSLVFEKDNTLAGKVKSTEESSRSLTFFNFFRDYKLEGCQKITTIYSETKILCDISTKPEPPAPGLQKSHDIAPIVSARGSNALQPPEVIEHKSTHIEKEQERMKQKTTKRDKFMWIFGSCKQA